MKKDCELLDEIRDTTTRPWHYWQKLDYIESLLKEREQ